MKKSSQNQKKILISGYYGFDNFGDEAILGVLTSKLKELGHFVTVLSSNPKKTSLLYGVKSIFSFCFIKLLFNLAKTDVLISGGGSLLQDVTSSKSLFYYLFVINMALLFRKKVIIFAQGIGPINNKFCAFLTKNTLKKCSLVTVRDRKSRLLLYLWGIEAELVCDPLFNLSLPKAKPENKVGVQLRSFKTLNDRLLNNLAQQICKEFSDKEIEIYSFQDRLDLEVCKKFGKILKSINPDIKTVVLSNQSSQDILDGFLKLKYLIAMRFHANLIALKYGIKTLAINYDIKVEKLAEDAQIPCISMNGYEDYDSLFKQMKNLDKHKLTEFTKTNHFDWSKIIDVM